MDFDPYENAKQMGDHAALVSWARYEGALLSEPAIAIRPVSYLEYEHPDKRNEYGAAPEIWEESIRQVVDIYEQSFAQVIASLPDDTRLERRPYSPPSGYGKGGPISYPIEVVQIVYDQAWLVEFGIGAFNAIVVEAVIASAKKLRRWMIEHKVPEYEQTLPSHNPFIVRAVVESHAHRYLPKLTPGTAAIHAGFPLDADYPVNGEPFLVVLPYPKGSVIYQVDDKLRLLTIIRTTPESSIELDSSGWLG